MKTVKNLFELLCVGLETKPVESVSLDLFREMSQEDWQALRTMADKQGVSAIAFDGLSMLVNTIGRQDICPNIDPIWWQTFAINWIALMHQVEFKNLQQLQVMEDMAKRWTEAGCRVMVMKGQACGTFYPHPDHRSPGDIDCYLINDNGNENAYQKGNDIAREAGAKVDEGWYKHSQIHYRGEMFENHQFFVHTRDGKRGKRLEKELEKALDVSTSSFIPLTSSIVMPLVQWNAMFLTYHACAHFISEGLRLKQVLDWAMFLKNHQDDVDWPRFYDFCECYHLRRFADAATAISAEYLNVNVNGFFKGSPYAERILHSALYDEDYVFGSGKGSWHNRWHLVRNLFHYRWKYEDIYQMSPWKQLWYYASGYLFKTE